MSGDSMLLVLISLTASISIMAFFLLKAKRSALFYSFVFYQIMVVLNLIPVHQILLSLKISNALAHYVLCDGVLFFNYCFTGMSWILFCIFYTGSTMLKSRSIIAGLILLSFCFFSFSMYLRYLNVFHFMKAGFWGRLARNVYGETLMLKVIVSCVFIGLGILLLLGYAVKHKGYLRKQSLLLSACVMAPLFVVLLEAYYNRGYGYYPYRSPLIRLNDLMCAGYALSSLLIVLTTFRYRFMNVIPAALRKAAQNMREGMLVVDRYGLISYVNDSFSSMFGRYLGCADTVGIREFAENLSRDVFESGASEELLGRMKNGCREKFSGSLGLEPLSSKFFDVSIEPFEHHKGRMAGSVVTFSDITDHRVLLDEIGRKCAELDAANKKLSEYALVAEELAAVKERNRVARDIHDSLGYTMTLLISLLEVGSHMSGENPAGAKAKLTQALAVAREGLEQVRRSVAGLASSRLGFEDLDFKLMSLTEGLRQSGISVNYQASGLVTEKLSASAKEAVYRACQEALTNSMKHGKAKNVEIVLRQTDNLLKLFILDDGCGCPEIAKGQGLAGMEQRVRNLGGYISYGSGEDGGFNIHIEIPAGDETPAGGSDATAQGGEADGESAAG